MPKFPNFFDLLKRKKKESAPVEVQHTFQIATPMTFDVMRDLQAAGLRILDPQTGRELHALINLPAYGLTRAISAPSSSNHRLGFVNERTAPRQAPPIADFLIDEKQNSYDMEAVLYLNGQANWLIEAKVSSLWVIVVTDAIDIQSYTKLLSGFLENYHVDIIATPLLASFQDGVRIRPSTIISGDGNNTARAVGGKMPSEDNEN